MATFQLPAALFCLGCAPQRRGSIDLDSFDFAGSATHELCSPRETFRFWSELNAIQSPTRKDGLWSASLASNRKCFDFSKEYSSQLVGPTNTTQAKESSVFPSQKEAIAGALPLQEVFYEGQVEVALQDSAGTKC